MSTYTQPRTTYQNYTNPTTGGTGYVTTTVTPGYGYSSSYSNPNYTNYNAPQQNMTSSGYNPNYNTTGYNNRGYNATGYNNTAYNNAGYPNANYNIPYSNAGYTSSNTYGNSGTYVTGIGHTSSRPHVHGEKTFHNPLTGNTTTIVTPGITNPITGKTHALGTHVYGQTGTGVYNTVNTGTNTGYGYQNANQYGSSASQAAYHNPYGVNIPQIAFSPQCSKCHGTGVSRSMFSGTPVPCTRCYTRAGYCKKCYGTGINYRKGKRCKRCQVGKRLNNQSSSSSDTN